MSKETKLAMAEAKNKVLEYFLEQIRVTTDALRAYDMPITSEGNTDVQKMKAMEEIKLRDRLDQLNHHILVLKLLL